VSDGTRVQDLVAEVRAFADARDWSSFHDPKNLVMALSSEVGELSALLRWVRSEAVDAHVQRIDVREKLEAELGDVAILLLLLSARLSLPLDQAVRRKLATNEARYPVETSRGRAERPSG
jgi:dCTP diphosphatase